MADFCTQCSVHLGAPRGWSDFTEEPYYPIEVLCEGCGPTIVDSSGRCISTNCLIDHKMDKECLIPPGEHHM